MYKIQFNIYDAITINTHVSHGISFFKDDVHIFTVSDPGFDLGDRKSLKVLTVKV